MYRSYRAISRSRMHPHHAGNLGRRPHRSGKVVWGSGVATFSEIGATHVILTPESRNPHIRASLFTVALVSSLIQLPFPKEKYLVACPFFVPTRKLDDAGWLHP